MVGFGSARDLHGLEREEDLDIQEKVNERDEDLANAIGEAIKDDAVDQAETEEILRIISPAFDKKKDKVVVGTDENGQLDTMRVRELKTTKQNAENIKDQVASRVAAKLTDEKSSDEEIELAESIGRSIVGSKVKADDIVSHVKAMKDVKLARTKVYNAKEKRYLSKIKQSESKKYESDHDDVDGLVEQIVEENNAHDFFSRPQEERTKQFLARILSDATYSVEYMI